MKDVFGVFAASEQGQDLTEYSLLLAFVCLSAAALFIGAGGSMKSIWLTAETNLSQAASAVS